MIRMALGFATVRRGLAAAVYHWWRRSHAFVQRPPAPPSPTIVLLPPADAEADKEVALIRGIRSGVLRNKEAVENGNDCGMRAAALLAEARMTFST